MSAQDEDKCEWLASNMATPLISIFQLPREKSLNVMFIDIVLSVYRHFVSERIEMVR